MTRFNYEHVYHIEHVFVIVAELASQNSPFCVQNSLGALVLNLSVAAGFGLEQVGCIFINICYTTPKRGGPL